MYSVGRRPLRVVLETLAVVVGIVVYCPSTASAVIHPAQVIAGPANNIIEVIGTTMASDDTGGALYRARAEGVVHLYVTPFVDGEWRAPLQVDREDRYGAGEAAIAAGEGGRLLVVWVQPRAVSSKGVTLYELQSASLAPGASGFNEAITVDQNVGEPYTGDASHVEPKLAMAPDGDAYVVYRVLTDECKLGGADSINPRNHECPSNGREELVDVRVARYDYLLWSSLGTINRNTQVAVPKPTPANAPTVGIGVEGNAVVAWQEPEAPGQPPRIWARRLFGTVQSTVLQASPDAINGHAVTSPAEAAEIAVSRFGEARLAYRIQGGQGSAVPSTQIYLNSMPSSFDPNGGKFEGPVAIPGATAADIGVPSAATGPSGEYRLAWSQGEQMRLVSGNLQGLADVETIGAGSGSPQTTVNPSGGGATVWPSTSSGHPVVEVREDYAKGAYQAATLVGSVPGSISGLSMAGSGQGDALAAWMQGPTGRSEVVGDFVQAPPSTLIVTTPDGWVRSHEATVVWEPVSDAVSGVTYAIYVDGHVVQRGLYGTTASLSSATLGNGVHQVQVLATDSAGQRTMSVKTPLKVDVYPPIVKVRLIRHRTGVFVAVSDNASGVDRQATRISFGDGKHTNGGAHASHVYLRGGTYVIAAKVRDQVGVGTTVHIRVKIR